MQELQHAREHEKFAAGQAEHGDEWSHLNLKNVIENYGRNAKADKLDSMSTEKEQETSRLRSTVNCALEIILEAGLEARAGTRLIHEPDLDTYLQIRLRWLPRAMRWNVCERCDRVFSVRRRMERDSYRCGACHNKRLPGLRPASAAAPCAVCGALFIPADARQVNCPGCQTSSVRRSRHAGVPIKPGTELREAVIDLDLSIMQHNPLRSPAPYWRFTREQRDQLRRPRT